FVGAVRDYVWFDIASSQLHTFLCYKVHAIRKRMTWDDALQYCRTYHRDLASVASETEMMLIEKELGKEFSKLTWIGLMRNRTDQTKWMWSGGSEVTEVTNVWKVVNLSLQKNYKCFKSIFDSTLTHPRPSSELFIIIKIMRFLCCLVTQTSKFLF
uniref:C-type lectin domain-containing protein n=1 Tax=Neogobius melanostomus TaxID=47308 RepID=A0A8C6UN75_9GOBI